MFGKKLVFLGGMSNYIGPDGALVRNPHRDALKEKVGKRNKVFDPQIDRVSHGRDYDSKIDGPAERQARANANVLVYEIGDLTLGSVTMFEIIRDVSAGRKVVVWFSAAPDSDGNQVFRPQGVTTDAIADPVLKAHMKEMIKAGRNSRSNLVGILEGAKKLRIAYSEDDVVSALKGFNIKF